MAGLDDVLAQWFPDEAEPSLCDAGDFSARN
jgi:hypothetical protein